MNDQNDRRTKGTVSDQALYQLSENSLKVGIERERRHDELERLLEVQNQKRVWRYIFYSCTLSILLLLGAVWFGEVL